MTTETVLTVLAGILSLMLTWVLGTLAAGLHGERNARTAMLEQVIGKLSALENEVKNLRKELENG